MKHCFAGVTFIEVLVIVMLLAIAAIPLHRYLTTSAEKIEDVQLYQIAASVSANHLEIFRNKPYLELVQFSDMNLPVPAEYIDNLHSKLAVREIIPGELIRIIVTTSWTMGRESQVRYLTLVSNQRPFTGFPRK